MFIVLLLYLCIVITLFSKRLGSIGSLMTIVVGQLAVIFSISSMMLSYKETEVLELVFIRWVSLKSLTIDLTFIYLYENLVMGLIVVVLSFLISLYSFSYLNRDETKLSFILFLLVFTFMMMFFICSANTITLIMVRGDIGLMFYFLINFWHKHYYIVSILIILLLLVGAYLLNQVWCIFIKIFRNNKVSLKVIGFYVYRPHDLVGLLYSIIDYNYIYNKATLVLYMNLLIGFVYLCIIDITDLNIFASPFDGWHRGWATEYHYYGCTCDPCQFYNAYFYTAYDITYTLNKEGQWIPELDIWSASVNKETTPLGEQPAFYCFLSLGTLVIFHIVKCLFF